MNNDNNDGMMAMFWSLATAALVFGLWLFGKQT